MSIEEEMEYTMRNMAWLWGLMTAQQCGYQERARKAANMGMVEKDPVESGDSARLEALIELSRRWGRGRQVFMVA